MFKCKITLEAFDTSNTKVENIDFAKAKNLSKAAIKKLADKEEEQTPFYLIRNYFQKNGKPVADFIALGTSQKMEMHFSKQEIKGNGVAQDKKDAAFGVAFMKKVKGKPMLHLQPNEGCKVPKGAWPKILKSLKPMLAGYKATVLLGDQPVLEEGDSMEEMTSSVQDKLEYKATVAKQLLAEVQEVTTVYNREQKEKLAKKTEKWLEAYHLLPTEEQTTTLQKAQQQIQQANSIVQSIIEKDDAITIQLDKVWELVDHYLEMEDTTTKTATQIAEKIITALNKIQPAIEELGDLELLKECQTIQETLL